MRPKSLRRQVVVLFATLAVGPLLALGITDYVRARSAVEAIVEAQTAAGAQQASAMIAERLALVQSEALLLSENMETQQLFRRLASPDVGDVSASRAAVDSFVRIIWPQLQGNYRAVDFVDTRGAIVLRMRTDSLALDGRRRDPVQPVLYANDLRPLPFAIRDEPSGRTIGTVVLQPLVAALIPDRLRELAFGRAGRMLVIEQATLRVLYDSRRGDGAMLIDHAAIVVDSQASSTVRYVETDSARLASIVRVPGVDWLVMSSAALPEFTGGLNASRLRDLFVVVLVAALVTVLFTMLLGRATRSLEELTAAARSVAQGELSPQLPTASDDEIGTLSAAFAHMLARIRRSMRDIELSRQLAVLGEFSAQLAHEIRNPLTAIKLNLQELTREVRHGRMPASAMLPLDTSLREVKRLDDVVRGVLTLARSGPLAHQPCHVHEVLRRAFALHAQQLNSIGIAVTCVFDAPHDVVIGDEGQLSSLFTNLIVNAIDAQPTGGRLSVSTRAHDTKLEITVSDDGPGVPDELVDRIFRPFVSGKPTGTGLGLSLASNAAREHGGTLELVPTSIGCAGATFRIVLPLRDSPPGESAT